MGSLTLEAIKELLNKQTKEIKEDILMSNNILKQKIAHNKEKINTLQKKCLFLERKVRKNNIVIFGLSVDGNKLVEDTLTKINTLLGIDLVPNDINNIYKIGRSQNPPLIIEFISFLKKLTVFENIKKLQSQRVKITITNDLCDSDRERHKILVKHYKLAKQNSLPSRIRGHQLQIDNKWYKAEELEDIVSDSEESEDESKAVTEGEDTLEEEEENKIEQSSQQNTEKETLELNKDKKRKTLSPPAYIQKLRKHKLQKL